MEKIEVGQVWIAKCNSQPICVVNIQDGFVYLDWFWENGINDCDGITIEHFLRDYEFYAQPIAYHDFKKWCMTRQKPVRQDLVNHPTHYTSDPSGIECIQITRHRNFNIGNAIKYLWRAGLKDSEIQDLEKAIWYIQDEIKRLRGNA